MERIAIKYGIFMFLTFLLVFGIVHVLGLSANYHFRLINGVIEGVFLWLALKANLREHSFDARETLNNYPSNVGLGMLTAAVGIIPFAICIAIYLSINEDFMLSLQQASNIGEYLTPVSAGFILTAEGAAFSIIASYIMNRALEQQKFPD